MLRVRPLFVENPPPRKRSGGWRMDRCQRGFADRSCYSSTLAFFLTNPSYPATTFPEGWGGTFYPGDGEKPSQSTPPPCTSPHPPPHTQAPGLGMGWLGAVSCHNGACARRVEDCPAVSSAILSPCSFFSRVVRSSKAAVSPVCSNCAFSLPFGERIHLIHFGSQTKAR